MQITKNKTKQKYFNILIHRDLVGKTETKTTITTTIATKNITNI